MKFTADSRFRYLVIGCILNASVAFSAFEPMPVGGRAAGMGEAYTAIVDDVYSLYYNPAGVLQITRPEIGSYYSQLYRGLTDNSEISRTFFGYAQPFGKRGRWGAIGASYATLDLPSLYKEESFGLTYGHEYRRLWNLGASVKLLRKAIGSDEFTANAIDPVTGSATGNPDPLLAAGRSESALGIDLGLQYRLTKSYALGLAARNINAPDIALGSEKDNVPAVYAAAIARHLRKGSLDMEVTRWKGSESNTRFALGGEHWFKNGIGLRAGGGFGSRDYAVVTFGASYKMQSFQFDYAMLWPLEGIEGTLGFQQVALTVRLGKPPIDPLEQQLLKEKEGRVRAETEARYAKAERDRLKKQLILLTQEKSRLQEEEEKRAAEQALEEVRQEQERLEKEQAAPDENRAIFNDYTKALSAYNDKVRKGISLREKRKLLEGILAKYESKGVNVTAVKRELAAVKAEMSKAKKDFDLSMNFYRRLVNQGAGTDERRSMLERIIQKYKGSGINIQTAINELKQL